LKESIQTDTTEKRLGLTLRSPVTTATTTRIGLFLVVVRLGAVVVVVVLLVVELGAMVVVVLVSC